MPQYLTMNFTVKEVGDSANRTLRFVGSTETADRDKDIIEVAGWQLENYQKNPVFLWAHQYGQPPIGKAINVIKDVNNKQLIFDIQFATADVYPFADTIYKLYKGGYMSATSVGFMTKKFKTRDDDEVLELPEWRRGYRIIEAELLELSAVPVPANPEAIITARSKGIIDDASIKLLQPGLVDLDGILDTTKSYQQKAGAALSAANQSLLITALDALEELADNAGVSRGDDDDNDDDDNTPEPPEPGEPEGDGCKPPKKSWEQILMDEIKAIRKDNQTIREELNGLKSSEQTSTPPPEPPVQNPPAQSESDEIDLDSIVLDDEGEKQININPESLKTMIQDSIQSVLDKAQGKIN